VGKKRRSLVRRQSYQSTPEGRRESGRHLRKKGKREAVYQKRKKRGPSFFAFNGGGRGKKGVGGEGRKKEEETEGKKGK